MRMGRKLKEFKLIRLESISDDSVRKRDQVRGSLFGLMDKVIKVCGEMAKNMEKGFGNRHKVTATLGSGLTVKSMDKAYIPLQMVTFYSIQRSKV